MMFMLFLLVCLIFALTWAATFTKSGRDHWVARGFNVRKTRWWFAATAVLSFVMSMATAPPPGKDARGKDSGAEKGPAALALPTQRELTELSKAAALLKAGTNRPEVLKALGQPSWVFLPGDKSKFAPKPEDDVAVTLIWKNGLCASVVADFNSNGELAGSDEGRGGCSQSEAEAAEFNPARGQFSCAETGRAAYCGMARTQTEARASAPVTATEIAAARRALCRMMLENHGKDDMDIPRANRFYQELTGADPDRTLKVMAPQFSALTLHQWSLDSCARPGILP